MPADPSPQIPRILTALPVFNEAAHVVEALTAVRNYADDVLVVDDGSSDATPQILEELSAAWPNGRLTVLHHEQNRGYGAALNTAFEYALQNNFDVLVTIDCDGQHEPRLIPEIAAALNFADDATEWDIVSGSRYLQEFAGDNAAPEQRRAINQQITSDINTRLGFNLTDAFCGFKAYRVGALQCLDITEFGYAMPLQVWVQAASAGMRITEFPVPRIYLDESRSFGGSLDDGQIRLAYYREVLDREIHTPPPCGSLPLSATGVPVP